ncbi:MAG: RHS repeat-associated core domain-containing protein [Chloroflexota bacterium]|nr:RHS repeat-associated core domain-containing protein [Chloroflexota bacterium]
MMMLGGWDGATWAYHLPDALGSVRQAVDGAGASSREWTPYGVELGVGQAGLGYTGEWWDADVGLLYLRARWYDGVTGRFTRRDPWRGHHQWPLTLNPYIYVLANPILRVDPTGLSPLCECDWPGCCGPDISEWFVEEIRLHWDWVDDEIKGSIDLPAGMRDAVLHPMDTTRAFFNLQDFAAYAKAIPYKWMNFRNLASGSDCPSLYTACCRNTVTLCDKCVNREELGNIMFGISGQAAGDHGIAPDLLYGAARNVGAVAKSWDQAAAGVGYYLVKTLGGPPATTSEMCDEFNRSHGSWLAYSPPPYLDDIAEWLRKRGFSGDIIPLSKSFGPGADWNWDDISDPTRAAGCRPCEVTVMPPHTIPAPAGDPHYHPYAGAPGYEYYVDQIPAGMLDPDLLYGGERDYGD